jgi:hypothetical protein
MNTSGPPTLAERMMTVPTGRLLVRLSLAQTAFARAQTPFLRRKSMDEIDAVKAEMIRRGLKVSG